MSVRHSGQGPVAPNMHSINRSCNHQVPKEELSKRSKGDHRQIRETGRTGGLSSLQNQMNC